MTRYEELKIKANRCREAAKRTSGRMRETWKDHAARLDLMASKLSLKAASQGVR